MKSFILFSLFSAALSSCPSGWIKFEDKCYRIEQSPKRTWQDARTQCLNMKGNLVRIYSDRENNFIKNELRKLHPGNSNFDQFWTAGNDLRTENVFVWDGMNDSINEYTDWAPNEPNQNGGNEDCIAFFPFVNYHWNDEHCDKRENYICEQLTVGYSCTHLATRRYCCSGYTGSGCATPICHGYTSCLNGGTCVGPNNCHCRLGYDGPRCEVPQRNVCYSHSGTWTQWSTCSSSCGGGTRTRQCRYDHPVTTIHETCNGFCLNGGTFYLNTCHCILGTHGTCCEVLETNVCNRNSNTWTPWSACSVSCGGGTRSRHCKYDHPVTTAHSQCNPTCFYGGTFSNNECHCIIGTKGSCCEVLEKTVCYIHSGTWSPWSSCSTTCGGGTRTRQCKYDHPVSSVSEPCSETCLNEGSYNEGRCQCVVGTHGSCCEVLEDNVCYKHSNTWSSWGVCSKSCGGGTKSRTCKYGHVATDLEHCARTCYNDGEYYSGQCHCVPGTTGSCCTDIPECASNPCKNGGVCEEHVNYYTCICPAGTSQPNCDDILECASNPCKNNGTCNEYINGFECTCVYGTTGPYCDDIPDCISDPCLNGGTCLEYINGYSCVCSPDYTGSNCADIAICSSHPCQNGATCNDLEDRYNCTCPAKYIGTNCEIVCPWMDEPRQAQTTTDDD